MRTHGLGGSYKRPPQALELSLKPEHAPAGTLLSTRTEGAAMSTNGLTGQRALVTGATSGIGRAVALQLARDGAEVLVHSRDAARGAETVQEITASGGKARFIAADLGDGADVQRLASDVGDVDILINNAGISVFAPTGEFDVDAFDRMFASNVRAPF